MPSEDTQYKPGQSGNPRGPKKGAVVSGRSKALQTLDGVLSEVESQAALREAFRQEIRDHPVRFWRQIIAPLLPKHAKLDVGPANAEEIRALGAALATAISGRKIPEEAPPAC